MLRSTGSRHAGSVVVAYGLKLLRGMWDLPGPGLEPVSPALVGRLLTTVPPEKPSFSFFELFTWLAFCLSLVVEKTFLFVT